jgi:hypothetical protein
MRDYWQTTAPSRATLIPETPDFHFASITDEIVAEYEASLPESTDHPQHHPTATLGLGDPTDTAKQSAVEAIKPPEFPPSHSTASPD